MKTFSLLRLQNSIKLLEGIRIQEEVNDTPRKVPDYQFCRSIPRVRNNPQLFGLSRRAVQLIGIDYNEAKQDPNTAQYLSGSKLMQGSEPLAHNYCGHQFGSWAGQLGDGRAHLLGSVQNGNKKYELQLKGSGKSPFSRFADGNSVVSSALRQFLASELMAGLGIPTTRAASLVIADQGVKRDPFYNGQIRIQKAAIVLRMSESFIRFGSLEVCLPKGNMFSQNPLNNRKTLAPLCDHAISRHFPDINYYDQDPYEELYKKLVKESAQLVALWQSVGFVHGVLNTDNMSLGGVTIDYGPFAFMDYFSKDYVSNATDEHQRYSYRRQPYIVEWNLKRLAQAMDPLFPGYIGVEYLKENYFKFYNKKYYELMCDKLGLINSKQSQKIVDQLIQNMHICGTHFTNLFRIIQEHSVNPRDQKELVELIVQQSQPTQFFINNLRAFHQLMNVDLQQILKEDDVFNPYLITEQKDRIKRKDALRRETCQDRNVNESKLWFEWVQSYTSERAKSKDKKIRNPKYILLNFIAKEIQKDIKQMNAEQSQKHLQKVLDVLSNPYEKNQWFEQRYWKSAPAPVKLTCSS